MTHELHIKDVVIFVYNRSLMNDDKEHIPDFNSDLNMDYILNYISTITTFILNFDNINLTLDERSILCNNCLQKYFLLFFETKHNIDILKIINERILLDSVSYILFIEEFK